MDRQSVSLCRSCAMWQQPLLSLTPAAVAAASCRSYRSRVLTEAEGGPTPQAELPRITVPRGLLTRNSRFLADNPDISASAAEGKQRLLIVAKDRRKNCYLGQRYPSRFGKEWLASGSWLSASKSVGDYFTILAQGRSNSFHQVNLESPLTSFNQLGLRPDVASAVGFTRPTLIQSLAAGPILAGWNTACLAETGNGKTLAYLVPLVNNLLNAAEAAAAQTSTDPGGQPDRRSRRRRRCVLVMCPTVDLARQIFAVAESFCQRLNLALEASVAGTLRCVLCIRGSDGEEAEESCGDIIVGLPDRILSLLSSGGIGGGGVGQLAPTACVLDEADCLLDDSFRPGAREALRALPLLQSGEPQGGLPVGTQIILASATMPPSLEEALGSGLLADDSFARISTPFAQRPPAQTAQLFVRASRETKIPMCLSRLKLNAKRGVPTLVFCNSTASAKSLAEAADAAVLHGGVPPRRRADILAAFTAGQLPVLVATDLASRGLDTLAARQLVNFDLPGFPAVYLHRLGRVGRVGSSGSPFCLSYAAEKYEVRTVQAIETAVRLDRPLADLDSNLSRHFAEKARSKRRGHTTDSDSSSSSSSSGSADNDEENS